MNSTVSDLIPTIENVTGDYHDGPGTVMFSQIAEEFNSTRVPDDFNYTANFSDYQNLFENNIEGSPDDDAADDSIWILTSTFIIFTMQSGKQICILYIKMQLCGSSKMLSFLYSSGFLKNMVNMVNPILYANIFLNCQSKVEK